MKSTFFLLLVFLLSTFHASAQTHFITAGQTQGMIFTDYVPDYYLPNTYVNFPSSSSYEMDIDINKDGIPDYHLGYYTYNSTPLSSTTFKIKPYTRNSIICALDTYHIIYQGVYPNDTINHIVARKFFDNDTLLENYDTLWKTNEIIIHLNTTGAFSGTRVLTNYITPLDSPYYYGLKIISNSDTILGYLHFAASGAGVVLDFACEGPTSTYTITSINDLPTDKSITTYPNPFTNQININYTKPFDYQITDYIGRVVLAGKAEKTINTEQLPAGNYLLVIKNEETYSVKKIVKNP